MKCGFAGAACTFQFGTVGSGMTKIANFRHGKDVLKVKSNLNGNGLTTAAQVFSHCSASGGNTVCDLLTGNKKIALDGVSILQSSDITIF
jgi:hypothetical protein